jgi:hypothetical protein
MGFNSAFKGSMAFQIPTYIILFPGQHIYEQKLTRYGSGFTGFQANV